MPTTFNIFVTGIVFLSLFLFWVIFLAQAKTIATTPTFYVMAASGMLLGLPLIYSPGCWIPEATHRIVGLGVGFLYLFSCLQLHFDRRTLAWTINILLLLVVIQAFVALQQLFVPEFAWAPLYGKRIYGTFFQPNVLASFIATGLALALMLFLLPAFSLVRAEYERLRLAGLAVILMVFSALLVWGQSRAGWLGGIMVLLLFIGRFGRVYPTGSALACAAILFGILVGLGGLWFGGETIMSISHEHSNQARWTMLQDTLSMIADKPLLGWGYGSFEFAFQHYRINQATPTIVTEIARHPHNEVLLWVVEGGVVALIGWAFILLGAFRVVCRARRQDREAFVTGSPLAGLPTALCIALAPIAIHTQLEYPFYQSALHYFAFLLLFAMADRLSHGTDARPAKTSHSAPLIATLLSSMALAATVATGFSLKGKRAITQTELYAMEDITPLKTLPALSRWLFQERVIFDEQVNALLTYNRTHDEQLLEQYRQWAQSYLTRRIDKNVYASLITILCHQGQFASAEHYRRDAARFFPREPTFMNTFPPLSFKEGK
ncbi:O-antigen ligase C-terminal domain-containing protein [Serratia marcescens]|nr:O-antigen ligase C-terminal domain-containing protein [Serratia marcescens]